MASHAIVIGIDRYDPAIGPLDGAVRDALDFAVWVIRSGGVPATNLRLLLDPAPAAPPPVPPAGVPGVSPASSREIRIAIDTLREGGERLYFYYAGHGASILEWQEDPFLIPPEFRDPRYDASFLLGFKDLFHHLGELPFAEQICLIDACRDFGLEGYEPVIPSGARRRLRERKGRQYVLFSVAPGQKAAETGQGIWTRTLLDGLEGRDYRPVTRGTGPDRRYEVRLDTLADWVRAEVARRIERRFLRDAARYVQTPQYDRDKQGGDPLMATFTRDTVPRAKLRVFVEPALAHQTCKVSVMQYVDGLGEEIPVESSPPPPLRVPVPFELRPSDYSIRAEAERFTVGSRGWTVFDDPTVRLTLEEMKAEPPAPDTDDGSKSHKMPWTLSVGDSEEPVRSVREAPLSFGIAPTRSGDSGTLIVTSGDPAALIEVLDARRKVVHQGIGHFRLQDLLPGIYRVRLSLPGAAASEDTVDVRPGAAVIVRPSPPATRLGASLVAMLRSLGVGIDESEGAIEYVIPSEALGFLAGVRLASLLAFAAFAAQQRGNLLFRRLRSFGVHRFEGAPGSASGVLTLVGTGAETSPAELESFLAECRLVLRHADGRLVGPQGFEPLAGLPAAGQRVVEIQEAGMLSAELSMPGVARARYALATLPDRLTVLVCVVEADGTVEMKQYLLRLPGRAMLRRSAAPEPGSELRSLRRLDLALSFSAAGDPDAALAVTADDLELLLAARRLDPLLGCLAGYLLIQTGQAARFARHALPHLLQIFPEVPDLHVLAGLCDAPERRGEHFEEALRRGLPIFAAGLRALVDGSPEKPPHLAEALASLIPGSLWTAWVARTPW